MQSRRHFLPSRPTLGAWLDSTVPSVGMLVWLEGDRLQGHDERMREIGTMPILIGDITQMGDGRGFTRYDELRVVAYAQIDLESIEVVNA